MATLTQIKTWIDGGWKKDRHARNRWYWYGLKRGIDTDGYYGFQCKDLVNAYSIWLGRPFTAGNAEALWRVPQNPWWTRVAPNKTPKIGDVFIMWYGAYVWDGKRNVWMQFGHTGLVRNVYDKTFRNLAQNWVNSNLNSGSPPAWVINSRNSTAVQYGIRGYLRPKLTTSVPTPAPIPPITPPYIVKSGDNLSAIATKYKTSVDQLVKWNKVKYPSLATNPDAIQIGWSLRVK